MLSGLGTGPSSLRQARATKLSKHTSLGHIKSRSSILTFKKSKKK